MKKRLVTSAVFLMLVSCAHTEHWVSFGTFSDGYLVKRVSVDTNSIEKTGPAEYTITMLDEYKVPQKTITGLVYTKALSVQTIRCDTGIFGTTRIAVYAEDGKLVFDSGASDRELTAKPQPRTVGAHLLATVCG